VIQNKHRSKIEYGDFQTPMELANKVCQKLVGLGVKPAVIIEPTCGYGNFIYAALNTFHDTRKIIGIELNQNYLQKLKDDKNLVDNDRVAIYHSDYFTFDWSSLIQNYYDNILILGNFPWVTNSQQGLIAGANLPVKKNFQNYCGLEALTGKSNFDISEWMLIKTVDYMSSCNGYIAMVCKTSVARKILNYIYSKKLNLATFATYKIDAKKYFDVSVEACLLFCKFDSNSAKYTCDVFENLESNAHHQIGYYKNTLVRDLKTFTRVVFLFNSGSQTKWRSGIKHDCSSVMELTKVNDILLNGYGEIVDIEDTYLYPLLKGSDVANGKVTNTDKYVLVTQKHIGESTEVISKHAPKTWTYLESHSEHLDFRRSKIYRNKPRFSIFGVGNYTFTPWKIAICGLYKNLRFRLIGEISNKPVIFDDTVYFLSFEDEETAKRTYNLLTSQPAIDFYSSLIFWDEKRPIKTSILNSLDLSVLEKTMLPDHVNGEQLRFSTVMR
jgi:hypothetical protein